MSEYAPQDINQWVGTGNLTRDPEVRTTHGGKTVTGIRVAVNNGGPKDAPYPPTFINVDVWNGQGEACAKYLRKGRGVTVVGRLLVTEGEKQGVKVEYASISAQTVKFDRAGKTVEVDVTPAASSDEDIPF